MKVLLLTFDYPPVVGGMANVLAMYMRRAGHGRCLILAPQGEGAGEFDRRHPVRTVRFPVWRLGGPGGKALNFAAGLAWTLWHLARQRPEVLIAGQLVRAGPIAYIWHKLSGRPYYVWVYGGETHREFAATSWLSRLLQHILAGARIVFTLSPFTTCEMRDFGLAAERVVEVPCGVDEQVFCPAARDPGYAARFGLEGKLVFLTVGRLVERKGIDTMLRALAALAPELPPWHYLILSDGPYRRRLEEMVDQLGLRRQVSFTGFVQERELPVYYNLCDIFAMPNREVPGAGGQSLSLEGFGIVFLEAAACGKPVIAGRSGGAVDAVAAGVNGFLVEPGNLEEIKDAIRRLLAPRTREAMGRAGIEFAARFSWERAAARLRPYLRALPGAGERRSPT